MAVRDEVRAGLWVAPDGDTARARPITASSNGREGATGIDWTRDGRIVYSATTQGSWDLWIANSDGSQPRQLTNDPGSGKSAAGAARWQGHRLHLSRVRRQRRSPSGESISTAAIHARSPPAAPSTVDISRQSETTCISRALRRDGRRPSARRLAAVRASRLFADPTRLPTAIRSERVSRPTNGGPSAPTRTRRVPAWRWCPSTGAGPVRRFPYNYTPGLGFGPGWAPGGHGDRRPGFPRQGDKPLAISARRLRAEPRDDLHVGADHELPVVKRWEDARDVARNGICGRGADHKRRDRSQGRRESLS